MLTRGGAGHTMDPSCLPDPRAPSTALASGLVALLAVTACVAAAATRRHATTTTAAPTTTDARHDDHRARRLHVPEVDGDERQHRDRQPHPGGVGHRRVPGERAALVDRTTTARTRWAQVVSPTLYGLDASGATVSTIDLNGATDIDWEDIDEVTIGGVSTIWVADVGDNPKVRPNVQLYRFVEPVVPAGQGVTVTPDVITLTYPGGAKHNVETTSSTRRTATTTS